MLRVLLVFGISSSYGGLDSTVTTLPMLLDAAFSVMFDGGREHESINNLAQAISHCRSGTGRSISAGKDLYKEMVSHESFRRSFDSTSGVFTQKLRSLLLDVTKERKNGFISNKRGERVTCSCMTLGSYSFLVEYQMPYECTDESEFLCRVNGSVVLSGEDVWDFEDVPSYSYLKNLFRERIPKFLVSLRGDMKPFKVIYRIVRHYDITVSKQIPRDHISLRDSST